MRENRRKKERDVDAATRRFKEEGGKRRQRTQRTHKDAEEELR